LFQEEFKVGKVKMCCFL